MKLKISGLLHKLLDSALVIKVADGILEAMGGLLLLVFKPTQIDAAVVFLTQHELSQDPKDLVANFMLRWAGNLTGGAEIAGAIYLLAHGAVKAGLAFAIIRERRWAYPAMVAFLTLFIGYDLYLVAVAGKLSLLLLVVFDALILGLTVREYRVLRRA